MVEPVGAVNGSPITTRLVKADYRIARRAAAHTVDSASSTVHPRDCIAVHRPRDARPVLQAGGQGPNPAMGAPRVVHDSVAVIAVARICYAVAKGIHLSR